MSYRYDYQQQFDPTSGFSRSTAVKGLIIANVAVFVLQIILKLTGNLEGFIDYFGVTPKLITSNFFLWQFFTYMFLHGGFMHLLLNMFGLFMFGPELEWLWGKKTFLKAYFAIGILSAAFQYLLDIRSPISILGASGAIYGLLGAFAALYPNRQIIFLIFPIKIKYFILFIVIIPSLLGTLGVEGDRGVAHAVHIAGVLLGIAYVKANFEVLRNANSWFQEQIRLWKIRRKYKNFKVVDKDVKKMWDDLEERINKDNKKDYIN
jgi:membrane associated rhomboid family serine protease